MAAKPIVACQFNAEPHELDDECQRVAYGTSGGVPIGYEVCGCCEINDYEEPTGDDETDVACVTCGHSPEEHQPAG